MCLAFFRPMGKICLKWPKSGPGVFFPPTNPDLVDILGDKELYFESFHFLDVFYSQVSTWAWARLWPGLGQVGPERPRVDRVDPLGVLGGPLRWDLFQAEALVEFVKKTMCLVHSESFSHYNFRSLGGI